MEDGGRKEKPEPKPAATSVPTESAPLVEGTQARDGFGGVQAQRKDSAEKALYRMSNGTQGIPPLPDLGHQRGAPVREALMRVARKASGAASGASAKIPTEGGAALSSDVHAKMAPKLGADLSNVRVHTGAESQKAAAGYGARAFTVGDDVHFNAGEYKPGDKEGDRLIAHELTHVVQGQHSGIQRKADADGQEANADPEVSQPHEPAEQEADQVADGVVDELHDGESGRDGADEKKPQAKADKKISAKLDGVARKVFLARGDDKGDKLKLKKEKQEILDKCGRCIKILEQFDRLAQKMKVDLPEARLKALTEKRNSGTLTGEDLPATLRQKYDLDVKMPLTKIRDLQKTTEEELKQLK